VVLLEVPKLHPATVIEAAAATVQAASHRRFLSIIAPGLHLQMSAIPRECLFYTSRCGPRAEALAFTSAQVNQN